MSIVDRREFLTGAGAAALASTVSPAKIYAQPASSRTVTRRAIHSMEPNDPILESYRLAVERMKALPERDPRNWNRIAQIHQNFCPHGNWFFLPWHRAYLISFERLCRQMSGNENFALPYWDWTEQRRIPAALTAPPVGGRRNALFDAAREMPANASLRASLVGPNIISSIFAETNFEMFGSTRPRGQNNTSARWLRAFGTVTLFEWGPHNTIHATIGGDMADMMAPRDPIFWLHHSNVDRLWTRWNALGRRNSTNPLWTNYPFNGMFPNPQGRNGTAPLNIRVADLLDTRGWGYTYPDLPGREDLVAEAQEAELIEPSMLASQSVSGVARLNTVLSTRLTFPRRESGAAAVSAGEAGSPGRGAFDPNALLREGAPLSGERPPAATPAPSGDAGSRRIFSVIENIKAMKGNAAIINVFLNSPDLTAGTSEADPHFVGSFGLFGLHDHGSDASHQEGLSVQIELTEVIGRLRQANRYIGSELEVQLVPIESRGDDLELDLERISITSF